MPDTRPNYSLTLARGLQVLRALARHPEGLTVTDLAAELATHRAGVYRLLAPLSEQRLVARDGSGRYTLGVGLVELASAVEPRLQEIAVRELRTLADEVRTTTALTVRDGDEAVVVAVVQPRNTTMHVAYRPGLRHPLDRGASGLAILAAGAPLEGERSEVAAARERGWARSTGELLPGATGVAVAIVARSRETEASVSAVWVDDRDPAEVARLVTRAAGAIADAL
jgi:DNA-binding IclR family transcriptional regulator